MAMVDADWTVDRATKNVRYVGDDHGGTAPSYATVIEFHRWLQDFADDEEYTGDDEHDIIDVTSSSRSTDNIITLINGYNITSTEAEHLYDGSIIQDGGDTIWDGVVNFGNVGIMIQLHQAGAVLTDDFWNFSVGGTHDGANDASVLTDSGESWTTDQWVGYVIRNVTDGSEGLITANTATTITAVLSGGTDNDWDTSDSYLISQGLNADSAQGISHRFMIQTRADGVDIDGRRLLGTNRTFLRTYGEFRINGTSRGNNVLALSDSSDLNNTTAEATVATWTTITNTEGLRLLDIDGNSVNEEYYSEWNRDTFTINQFFERMKYLTRDRSSSTLNGQNGELFRGLTHSFAYDNETGTMASTNDEWVFGEVLTYDTLAGGPFVVGEAIHGPGATPAWKGRVLGGSLNLAGDMIVVLESGTVADNDAFTGQTSGATAAVNDATPPATGTAVYGRMALYAIDDDGTTGNLYGQLLSGVAPVDNTRLYSEASTANFVDVNGSVTERTISTPFIGQSTGSALIGAYGVGMEEADTSASDTFFDLGNVQRNPPNNVTFTVFGLVSGEDRVLVTNDNSGAVDLAQFSLNTALTGAAETSVVITTAIPSDTPTAAGTTSSIRVERDSGLYSIHRYTSWTGSTFTIPSTDFSTDNASATNNVFLGYIDKLAAATSESFTVVYNADRTLFVRVRDGGVTPIITFETTATLGNSGGSTTAIRTADE